MHGKRRNDDDPGGDRLREGLTDAQGFRHSPVGVAVPPGTAHVGGLRGGPVTAVAFCLSKPELLETCQLASMGGRRLKG